jgi:Sec-independent protein translocase protein TatA
MKEAVWIAAVVAGGVALLFAGRSFVRELLDDAAKGIRAFRDGL